MKIKFGIKEWYSQGIKWLNRLAYAGLATVAAIQGAEIMGLDMTFLTEKQKQWIAIGAIAFKFIEKLFGVHPAPRIIPTENTEQN